MSAEPQTKKFGKGERVVPHHSQKAQKWYSTEDESRAKKVRDLFSDGQLRLSRQRGSKSLVSSIDLATDSTGAGRRLQRGGPRPTVTTEDPSVVLSWVVPVTRMGRGKARSFGI